MEAKRRERVDNRPGIKVFEKQASTSPLTILHYPRPQKKKLFGDRMNTDDRV